MTTPAMLTRTATTFAAFKVSWPKNTPMKRVKSPDVDDKTVVLATLVRASAAFDKYCPKWKRIIKNQLWFLKSDVVNQKSLGCLKTIPSFLATK